MKTNLHKSDIQRNYRSASRRRDNRAFTLIELLVVIAIIAVLAAMLLPALSSAKNRAQMAVDLNNVHQIMMAVHLYATDNRGYLPQPGEWMNVAVTGTIPGWCNGVPCPMSGGAGSANPTRAGYDQYYPLQVRSFKSIDPVTMKMMLRAQACLFTPYLQNERVLRCPADVPNTLFYKRQVLLTSYCWNGCVCYGPNQPTLYYQPGNVAYYPTFKLSQFKADDILLWENDETLVTDWGQWDNTVSYADNGISARHGKGGTVGNADGSAERILLSTFYMMACNHPTHAGYGWGSGAGQGQPLPNRVWCCPVTANGVP